MRITEIGSSTRQWIRQQTCQVRKFGESDHFGILVFFQMPILDTNAIKRGWVVEWWIWPLWWEKPPSKRCIYPYNLFFLFLDLANWPLQQKVTSVAGFLDIKEALQSNTTLEKLIFKVRSTFDLQKEIWHKFVTATNLHQRKSSFFCSSTRNQQKPEIVGIDLCKRGFLFCPTKTCLNISAIVQWLQRYFQIPQAQRNSDVFAPTTCE